MKSRRGAVSLAAVVAALLGCAAEPQAPRKSPGRPVVGGLAERAPMPVSQPFEARLLASQGAEPAAPPPTGPGKADLDPHNDAIVAPPDPIGDCGRRLEEMGITFRTATLPIRRQRSGIECGAPEVVVYQQSKSGVRYRPAPLVTCGMALALARFEVVLQEEAERQLGVRVAGIDHLGTYNCRKMARFELVSEHSYANAIDVETFRLANGRRISVERYFGKPETEPRGVEGRFLRSLARRLYDDGVFSVVVTEFFDRLHRNHFHLDLARYRIDGTR